ncbi:glycosyltransferase family 39 protein [Saccharopolyspora cebuensis]|uniref:Glycosyltransferase family 39 protein n=1 Tax=Saccharopolyspora cebuensis TaxID=418759 RepID=A0ABV4CD14_9PSEU
MTAARSRAALAAICALAAALYGWGIGSYWGNAYYSAAVESMTTGLENFFFGSFDAAGVVTVDKPPMALWAQVLSVSLFGFNEVAVLLPQAVAGVAAVLVLHRAVRRWAGDPAALLAALVLALTPITVVINRDNNPDTLLVLLVVGAAYAMTRAFGRERAMGWLALAAFLVGCGFLTKMLQAWLVLPALLAAYLVGSRASWGRRAAELAVAAAVLLVGSFWWVVATSLWPSPKPYIGGSTDGSAWDLVFGYNGFGRVLGGGGNIGGGGFSGEAGPLRLFNHQLGGQISWLLPLCALVLVAVLVSGVRRWRSGPAVPRERVAGWVLWGGWLGVVGLVFSTAQGTMHPYYTTMLAPAVAAITGAGLVRMVGWYRRPGGRAWLLLPAGVLITAAWAVALVLRAPDWHPWAGWIAAVAGVLAVGALLTGRRRAPIGRIGAGLGLVAVLAVPAAWSVLGAVSGAGAMGGVNPTAGPATMGGPGGAGPDGGTRPGGDQRPGGDRFPDRGQRPGGASPGGPGSGSLSEQQRALAEHVSAEAGGLRVPLAVEGGANAASSYLLGTDLVVVGMGGFMGSDDAPSVELLTEWQRTGQLGFVLLGGGPGGGFPPGADLDGSFPGGPGGMPGGQVTSERQSWVEQHCTLVDPAEYGGAADDQLYDCR